MPASLKFSDRCNIAAACLPRSGYRTSLEALHAEMLAEIERLRSAEPMFYVRLLEDGCYEGPKHANSASGKLLRSYKPGEWSPLYVGAPIEAPAAGKAA